ncbi:NAD-dependent epimerase/dehydratase family protein [Flavobacterium sp.]|uniref:NAD-dependent epimerase/dehydratase family protein n=1 Tax=Flavobacterium sp. TaxID=239 RepID=UPI00286C5987|nr:NAD-dependent epimerase/dehydratase family protein [Flavobacterium sp.]
MNVLVTGGAGFIGSTLIDRLLLDNHTVLSIDNYDTFYEKKLKVLNQKKHFEHSNFSFIEVDIRAIDTVKMPFAIDCIIHIAAKAGVIQSIANAKEYFDVNVNGTLAMLEFAKNHNIKQFLFASSSSVYGVNKNVPWTESELDLQPISPYASSKLACEKIGFTYSHLYGIRFLALRFFTVYGPRQRPDLAINKFFRNSIANKPIEVYGDGTTKRDYTYVDDIVNGIMESMYYDKTQFEIINLGNNNTIQLKDLIHEIGKITKINPTLVYKDEQQGDVPQTFANSDKSSLLLNYNPRTLLADGLQKQFDWMNIKFKVGS